MTAPPVPAWLAGVEAEKHCSHCGHTLSERDKYGCYCIWCHAYIPDPVVMVKLTDVLQADREREGWQPIATAKPNTMVLGFRDRSTSGRPGDYIHVTMFDGYNWVTLPGKYSWLPTYWHPLPGLPVGPVLPPAERETP